MLELLVPANALNERLYIADVLLNDFLGLGIETRSYDGNQVCIKDEADRRLILDDSFFCGLNPPRLSKDKLPALPLASWRLEDSIFAPPLAGRKVPVLFGKLLSNGSYLAFGQREGHLGIDVFGSAFFMLTRYEEPLSETRDEYDRVPASASIASQAGFLDRPIVNEYVELLWHCLTRLWSGLRRPNRRWRLLLSHDVDQPFLLRKEGLSRVFRTMAGDAVKRGDPIQGLHRPAQWLRARLLGPEHDPAYTFDYIMDTAEKYGVRSAFYFIPSTSAGPPDYRYGIHDPDIQALLRRIDERGHEIGYHASIETYRDKDLIQQELQLLREGCATAGVKQTVQGSRQHYLRIDTSVTPRHLASAGLAYDTSLSFADRAGFRCGTCWEYPWFDLEKRARVGLTERPLIVMECSVIDEQYMGLGSGQRAYDFISTLARTCREFCGDFTLLWHNTRFVPPQERRLFEDLLQSIAL